MTTVYSNICCKNQIFRGQIKKISLKFACTGNHRKTSFYIFIWIVFSVVLKHLSALSPRIGHEAEKELIDLPEQCQPLHNGGAQPIKRQEMQRFSSLKILANKTNAETNVCLYIYIYAYAYISSYLDENNTVLHLHVFFQQLAWFDMHVSQACVHQAAKQQLALSMQYVHTAGACTYKYTLPTKRRSPAI